jgi:outer membrane protein
MRCSTVRCLGAILAAGAALVAYDTSAAAQSAPTAPAASGVRTLTLPEAVSIAMERSRRLGDARLGRDAAEERVTEARSRVLPRVDLSLRYIRHISAPPAFLPAIILDPDADPGELIQVPLGLDNRWTSALTVEQPLLAVPSWMRVRVAERNRALQTEAVRGEAHTVITRVRGLYYDVLLAAEQERLAANALDRARASLQETQALHREGLASEYDVLRFRVEVANLEPEVRRARTAHRHGLRALAVEIGIDHDPEALSVSGSLAAMDLDAPETNGRENSVILASFGAEPGSAGADALLARAFEDRSELRQLGIEREMRRGAVRAERAEFLPRISLFGSYDIEAQQDGAPRFFGDQRGYGRLVGVQLSVPLFTGFARTARTDRLQAEARQTTERLRFAREGTEAEVRSLVEVVEESRSRARGQRLAVGEAERAYRTVSALYGQGIGSRLEVADAQVALRRSELNYAEAVHEYLVARARLDAATGQVPGYADAPSSWRSEP